MKLVQVCDLDLSWKFYAGVYTKKGISGNIKEDLEIIGSN